MKTIFKGVSLNQCLEEASKMFNINKNDLDYEVIEEKRRLFRNKCIIKVKPIEEEIEKPLKEIEKSENFDMESKLFNENKLKSGTIKVVDGKISVTNPQDGDAFAKLIVDERIKLKVNDKPATGKVEVKKEDKIEVELDEVLPTRHLDVSVTEDKMKAYITINYTPGNVYVLEDLKESNIAFLKKKVSTQKMPPKYTIEEIKQELSKQGIIYGIIEENIKKCVEKESNNVLIAEGFEVINGQDDTIKYNFQVDPKIKELIEDKTGKVDFKSIGLVKAVKPGDVLATKIVGSEGRDGKDIKGKIKKAKLPKKITIRIGQGCKFRDNNTVESIIYGKPSVKSNVFYVYEVHEVNSDVDLSTGNIKFIGDIIIQGSVTEGMKVTAGNSINIVKNVERSDIKANGDINIEGNIIAANIQGGGEDVDRLKLLENLKKLKKMIDQLITTVEEIKKFNLLGKEKKDGEIIKVLIENKFKFLPKICLNIITGITIMNDSDTEKVIIPIIKQKLIGLGPISIKHYSELEKISEIIEGEIVILKGDLTMPVNIKIKYCQDSNVNSSGDIVITGKGEYISNVVANGGIYFLDNKSVARGGMVKAKNEIKCKTVGSIGNVKTKLIVEEKGHIWADIAYGNTMFILGQREFLLEVASKNVHAYIDRKGELVVERLLL